MYINEESNHPASIIKNIPKRIIKRLNKISSSEKEFKEAIKPYQQALKDSGHKESLGFEK